MERFGYWFTHMLLLDSSLENFGSYDPQISGWLILLMSSVVLTGMGLTLKTDICAINDAITCRRNDFGIAIGSIVGIFEYCCDFTSGMFKYGCCFILAYFIY